MSNLLILPYVVIDLMCEHLHQDRQPVPYVPGWYHMRNRAFLDLCLTCKSMHVATKGEFCRRFGCCYFYNYFASSASFRLNHTSLTTLLHLSECAMYEERRRHVTIKCDDQLDKKSKGVVSRRPCLRLEALRDIYDGIKSPTKEVYEYERSPECLQLLSRIFSDLTISNKLVAVRLYGPYDIFATAIRMGDFENPAVDLYIDRNVIENRKETRTWNVPRLTTGIVRGVRLTDGCHEDRDRLTSASLSGFIQATKHVRNLQIHVCNNGYIMRNDCDTCADLFGTNFQGVVFSNLRNVSIKGLYINAELFRNFLTRHQSTIRAVDFRSMYLTSGSWRQVFRTLDTTQSFAYLHLGNLYQTDLDGTLRHGRYIYRYEEPVCYTDPVLVRDTDVVPYLENTISAFDFHAFLLARQNLQER
jgi:hypothetical protein